LILKNFISFLSVLFILLFNGANYSYSAEAENEYIGKSYKYVVAPIYEQILPSSYELFRVKQDNKYGWINKNGEVVIPTIYDLTSPSFTEGLASVKVGGEHGKWGFIDKIGNFIINPSFDAVDRFKNGICRVMRNIPDTPRQKYFNINRNGEEVNDKNDQQEILTLEQKKELWYEYDVQSGKYGYVWRENFISKKPDRFVIEPIFDEVNYFSEGLAAVRIGDENSGKWAFIDERGKIILPPKFDDISFGFSQGLAPVAVLHNGTKKWGYIDKNGQFKIQPQYFGAHIFYENLAPVKIGMKWGELTGHYSPLVGVI
jgi:hypothetical protein